MDPYESPRLDPFAEPDLIAAEYLPPDPAGEQIGLLHGGLFVAGLGVVACANPYVRQAFFTGEFPFFWWPLGILVVIDAAGLAALVLAVWRRVERRRTFPAWFGHWLLLAQGIEWSVYAVYQPIYYALTAGVDVLETVELPPELEIKLRAIYSGMTCLGVITPAVAMYYSRGQKLWQRYAPLLMASTLWVALRHICFWEQEPAAFAVTNVISFLALICFLIAAARDIRQPAGQDQVHWIGVGVHCAWVFYNRFVEYYWGPA